MGYLPDEPGWYDMPGVDYKRYRDQNGWTEHYLPKGAPEPATPPGQDPEPEPRRLSRTLAIAAAVLIVLLLAVGGIRAYAHLAGSPVPADYVQPEAAAQ